MKSAVFDPSIFHISEADWFIDEKRDCFLEHLFENLTAIDQYRIAKIIWNEELETCLWLTPQTPPWRKDKDWSNQLVPVIHKLLQRNISFIELGAKQSPCDVNPSMEFVHQNTGYCFLKLMHSFIKSQEEIFLCLGLPNVVLTNALYSFSCKCCPLPLSPNLVFRSIDWLKYVDIINEYWPIDETENDKLSSALNMFRVKEFNGRPFLYKFGFSSSFLATISQTHSDKSRILRQMVKKLISTNQESARDPTLHDEYLEEQKEFRFRVTPKPKSIRIHYDYTKDRNIYFLSFYDAGQHDKGLR
jgi:hypothetical protein